MGDSSIIGRLLKGLDGVCRHCECSGGTCKTETGEKCELVCANGLWTICTGVACQWAEVEAKRKEKRAAERRAAEEARLKRVPYWMQQRKAQQKKSGQGRKRRKLKGRAA